MKKPKSSQTPVDIAVLLGRNISQARRNKEWMQQELAEKVKLDPVSISRIETGASMPSIKRLADIADALDVSLSDLVGGISSHASDQVQEIADCLKPLNVADRQLVLNIVRQFSVRLANKS